jgi:hypothetical protein
MARAARRDPRGRHDDTIRADGRPNHGVVVTRGVRRSESRPRSLHAATRLSARPLCEARSRTTRRRPSASRRASSPTSRM